MVRWGCARGGCCRESVLEHNMRFNPDFDQASKRGAIEEREQLGDKF